MGFNVVLCFHDFYDVSSHFQVILLVRGNFKENDIRKHSKELEKNITRIQRIKIIKIYPESEH